MPTSITVINASDLITNSRAVINSNFASLNTNKLEASNNLSDVTTPATARNNILPTQATYGGKVLGTDGSNVSWVDPSGAALATQSVQGITALSVAATDPTLPKAVGDNDPRMPTQAMRDAMAGSGTPSGSNKYVTADTDALKELLSNKATSTSLGTSDSLYPSQNAVKVYVDTNAPVGTSNGVSSKSTSDASTTQNIAHGLVRIPKKVKLRFNSSLGTTLQETYLDVIYNGTTIAISGLTGDGTTNLSQVSSTSNSIVLNDINTGGRYQTGVLSMDATNIIIAWTKTATPVRLYYITWEAQ